MRNVTGHNSRAKWLQGAALALSLCLVGYGVGLPGQSTAERASAEYSLSKTARGFSLGSTLPTKRFITLGEGRLKERRWGAFAFRPARAESQAVVCLEIVVLRDLKRMGQIAIQSGGPECGPVKGSAPQPVLTQFDLSGLDTSLLALATPSVVNRVELSNQPHAEIDRRLLLPTHEQKHKAKIQDLAFTVIRTSPISCVEKVTGFKADGAAAFETPARDCASE